MSTFLDVVELLISNDEAKASYADNPSAFLEGHGLDALDPTDVADAMQYAGDALPLPVAVLIDPEAGLDSAAAIDLEAQGLSLERETFAEGIDEPGVALEEDVPFDDIDDTPSEDVVDLLDAADAPSIGADPALLDEAPATTIDDESPLDAVEEILDTTPNETAPNDTIATDTADYLTDTTALDESNDAPLDDYESDTALDDLDAQDVHDHMPDDFDLLD